MTAKKASKPDVVEPVKAKEPVACDTCNATGLESAVKLCAVCNGKGIVPTT